MPRVKVTNAGRVVFPDDGITKGDVVDYYSRVGTRMIPFLSGRALTVERYPKGLGSEGFMQKNAPDHYPEDLISRHEVPKEGGVTVYPVIHSAEAIGFFANLGVITFHVPPGRLDQEHPDWIIWDLDPPPGRLDLVREASWQLRETLESLSIPTMPMTSGSKGYHLRAKLQPALGWEPVATLARGAAALALAESPGLMTLAFRKSERGDRVFVDWLRNAPYSTSVSPWSLRARVGAPVAVPLDWDELDMVEPDGVRLESIDERLDVDPWSEMAPLDLTTAAEQVAESLRRAGITLEPFDRFRS